jgi:nucleoside-diphosphate-sugar epimerase
VKVLVTGANGMIGTAVLGSDASAGASVRAQVGLPHASGPAGVGNAADGEVACDITDYDALRPVADGVDAVIHLAGPPSVADSFAEAAEFLRVHVLGTETVVRLCRDLGIGRLVYVSSAEVYGRPARNPVDERAPFAPRSPYAAAKVAAESVIGAATRAGELDAVILRPFSIYGPGLRAGSVVGLIVDQALAGGAIRLRSLDSVRDYCYVGDLAHAVWRAAIAESAPDRLGIYNIASGHGTRVDELAWSALSARPAGSTGGSVEGRPDTSAGADRPIAADILELVADVGRARDELGWEATTTLADGLGQTLDWFATTVAGR